MPDRTAGHESNCRAMATAYRVVSRQPSKHGANMGDGRSLRGQTQSVMARASVAPKSGAFPPAGNVPKIVANK